LPQQMVWQPLIRVMVREPKAQHPRLTNHAARPSAMFGRCHLASYQSSATKPALIPHKKASTTNALTDLSFRANNAPKKQTTTAKTRMNRPNLLISSFRTVPLPQTQASPVSCRGSNRPAAHKTAVAESRRSALQHQIAYCLLSASPVHFLLVPACKVSCRYGT
jgi:hypothetical protein